MAWFNNEKVVLTKLLYLKMFYLGGGGGTLAILIVYKNTILIPLQFTGLLYNPNSGNVGTFFKFE